MPIPSSALTILRYKELLSKQKAQRNIAWGAWFAAVVTGCVWVFYDNATLQPLYAFVALSMFFIGGNSLGLSRVYGELHQMQNNEKSDG